MKYKEIKQGRFIERPNRFIAYCEIEGQIEKVHVKNTGRCRELLVPDIAVYLEYNPHPNRKTAYSLIAVQKGKRLVNIDSQAPNTVAEEALKSGQLTLPGMEKLIKIKREQTYGKSRFDFYLEDEMHKAFMEVKGATLEQEDFVMFPDAKTERGVKHVEELMKAVEEGYKAYILFVIQMSDIRYFTPHVIRHPEFARALYTAYSKGVKVLAYTCQVEEGTLSLEQPVPVHLPSYEEIEALLKDK